MMDSAELDSILKCVLQRLEKEFLPLKGDETWDVRARRLFYRVVIDVFREKYLMSEEEAKEYIYVEGLNPFPGEKSGKVFNCRLYPDAILKFDDAKIAIELDRGKTGSKMKNALLKAGIHKLAGNFQKIILIFFAYGKLSKYQLSKKDQKILAFYRDKLKTYHYLLQLPNRFS